MSSGHQNHPINTIAGGVGGIFAVLTGHPFDTIKVRVQTLHEPKNGSVKSPFHGALGCLKYTIRNEGVLALYKGLSTPLLGSAPVFALYFFGYSLGRRMQQTDSEDQLSFLQVAKAGAFAGLLTTSFLAPGERIKCLLQIQHNKLDMKYSGPIDALKKLYTYGGIKNLYKGTAATLLRDLPGSAIYFSTYDCLMHTFTGTGKNRHDLGITKTFFAGGIAGLVNWFFVMPADVLKSRLQTAPNGTYPKGVRDVFREIVRQEGILTLYKGLAPVMLRAFPANAACFLGYELTISMFNKADLFS